MVATSNLRFLSEYSTLASFIPGFEDFWKGYTQALGFTAQVALDDNGGSLFDGIGEFEVNFPNIWEQIEGLLTSDEKHELLVSAVRFYCLHLAYVLGKEEVAGHDFHCTRNEHGAGFFDGDWPGPIAEILTAGSKEFSRCELFGQRNADDGKLASAFVLNY